MGASKVVRNHSAVSVFKQWFAEKPFSSLFERLICAKLFKSSEMDHGYD